MREESSQTTSSKVLSKKKNISINFDVQLYVLFDILNCTFKLIFGLILNYYFFILYYIFKI